MGKKNIAINIIANMLSFIISFGISFFLTPFIIRTIGAEAYGFVALGNTLISYIVFITYSLNLIAGRYVTIEIHQNNFANANKYFSSVLIINVVLSIIIVIPTTLAILHIDKLMNISPQLVSDVELLFMFIIINFILTVLSSCFGVATYATNKVYLTTMRSIESTVIKCIVLVGLYMFFSSKVFYIGAVLFLTTVYNFVWNIYYMQKLLPEIKVALRFFNFGAVKELIISGFWNVITKIGEILLDGLDILICNILISSAVMGTLAIAKTIPGMILTLVFLLVYAYLPSITISYAKEDIDDMKKILIQCVKIIGAFINVFLVMLVVLGDMFYKLWVPTQDEKVLYILSILIAMNLLIRGPSYILSQCFLVVDKLRNQAYAVVLSGIISITIVFILLNNTHLGVYAVVGVSSIVIMMRELVFTLPYAAKCLDMKWNTFYPAVMKNALSFFIALIIIYPLRMLFQIDSWLSLLICTGGGAVMVMGVGFIIVFSKDEKKNVLGIAKRAFESIYNCNQTCQKMINK